MEVLRYKYRELFNLTSREMDEEPLPEFFTNLYILAQIKEKQRHMEKYDK